MGSITAEEIGPEARLPRIRVAGLDYTPTVEAQLRQAVERYQRVHAQCEAHMARGEEMDSVFQALNRERWLAIQAVMEISPLGRDGMRAKLEVLQSIHTWFGPDESVVPLAMHIAEEAVAFLSRDDLRDKRSGAPAGWVVPVGG